MKFIKFFILLICIKSSLMAQKPILSDTAYKSWSKVTWGIISANGRYASYSVINSNILLPTVVIAATDNSWRKNYITRGRVVFSKNGHDAFLQVNNKLLRIKLSSDEIDTLASCNGFELTYLKNKEYLIYITSNDSTLVLNSISSGKINSFPRVYGYQKSEKSGIVVFGQHLAKDTKSIKYFETQGERLKDIFSGEQASNFVFDNAGVSIVFSTEKSGNRQLWYYRNSMNKAKPLINEVELEKGSKISFGNFYYFSLNDNQIILTLEDVKPRYRDSEDLDLWNYQDQVVYQRFKMNNYQAPTVSDFGRNLSVVDVNTGLLTRLAKQDENVVSGVFKFGNLIPFEAINQTGPYENEKSYSLYNLANGKREYLHTKSINGLKGLSISPDERFVIFYDADKTKWICYDTRSKQSYPFASDIMSELFPYEMKLREGRRGNLNVLGWVEGTDHVILQGTYDLWEISVSKATAPFNLTGNGKTKRLIYSLVKKPVNGIFKVDETLYVYSQSLDTKENALYRLNLKTYKLNEIRKGNFYWAPFYQTIAPSDFQKAEESAGYLFMEPSVSQSSNYFFTKDFKQINRLSDNYPEENYNWITSELLTYKDVNGTTCQAILYKPKDFDPQKKYPIIFSIYSDQSHQLNKYISPEPVGASLNVPYMVSNGYVVCKPDVYVAEAKVGEYALLSLNAAADYLKAFDWADSTKMGLIGHSFGGFEVNYIITKTSRFAAAVTGAGVSSVISSYNDLWGDNGDDKHGIVTTGSYMMGRPLEEITAAYIENSPILHCTNIGTPLLIVHNEDDKNVAFYHATQFFLQLRSMKKKVWLLSYPKEGHVISNPRNQIDYQGKIKAYFDYYLKDKPEPTWMNKHITLK